MTDRTVSRQFVLAITDIVGSVALKERVGQKAYLRALRAHDEVLREVLGAVEGAQVLNDTGDGRVIAFEGADAGVRACLEIQHRLAQVDWSDYGLDEPLGVRAGVNTGQVALIPDETPGRAPKVVGLPLDLAARIMALGEAGRVVVAGSVFEESERALRGPTGEGLHVRWRALGRKQLKGRRTPMSVYEAHYADTPAATEVAAPGADEREDAAERIAARLRAQGGATDDAIAAFGRYRLLSVLGEGGFGVVYLAEQTRPVRRRVALKLIKPGMDSSSVVARFEAERQALALMDHPGVAKILDGGVTDDGLPFFAMELCRGLSLTEHCDTYRLDLRARIELFIKVCEAVQHAHSKGVIHRDLKPANVLVEYAEGVATPKVIDFGIAKALSQKLTEASLFTEQGQLVGTPSYMSPEQAGAGAVDIDTRTDVYALGVMLYELLAGSAPIREESLREAAMVEVQRIIREVEPPRPSARLSTLVTGDGARRAMAIAEQRRADVRQLTTTLKRDLDWVVMKSIEKQRERRYDTPVALASDLRRFLHDEPVEAGPPSVRYRAGKFIKRHRAGVVAASIILVLLVGGLAGTGYGLLEAREQERLARIAAKQEQQQRHLADQRTEEANGARLRAEQAEGVAARRARELQEVVDFQSEQLASVHPPSMGLRIRAMIASRLPEEVRGELDRVNFTDVALGTLEADVFERALVSIDRRFEDEPLVRAQLLHSTSSTMNALGLCARAHEPAQTACDLLRGNEGAAPEALVAALNELGLICRNLGWYPEAEEHFDEALALSSERLEADDPEALHVRTNRAALLRRLGRASEAESVYRSVLETLESSGLSGSRTELGVRANLGLLLMDRGAFEEARDCFRAVLDGAERSLLPDDPMLVSALDSMGVVSLRLGEAEDSIEYLERALETSRASLGEWHPSTLTALHNLGATLANLGRYDEAVGYVVEAYERTRASLGEAHPETIESLGAIGALERQRGHLEEAIRITRDVLRAEREAYGDEHAETLATCHALGVMLFERDAVNSARERAEEAYRGRAALFGEDDPLTLASHKLLADTLYATDRYQEAEGHYAAVVAGAERVGAGDSVAARRSRQNRVACLILLERFAEAEPLALAEEARCVHEQGVGAEDTAYARQHLAELYGRWARLEPDAGYESRAQEWVARYEDTVRALREGEVMP